MTNTITNYYTNAGKVFTTVSDMLYYREGYLRINDYQKILTGPSKEYYLNTQTQDSCKSFHFCLIVIIYFPLTLLLSCLSSDQF